LPAGKYAHLARQFFIQACKTLDLIIKERRLRWFEHVLRINDDRIPKQAISLEMSATSQGLGRLRKNWNDIICIKM